MNNSLGNAYPRILASCFERANFRGQEMKKNRYKTVSENWSNMQDESFEDWFNELVGGLDIVYMLVESIEWTAASGYHVLAILEDKK